MKHFLHHNTDINKSQTADHKIEILIMQNRKNDYCNDLTPF